MYGVKLLVAVGLGVAGSFGTYQAIATEGPGNTPTTTDDTGQASGDIAQTDKGTPEPAVEETESGSQECNTEQRDTECIDSSTVPDMESL